jgi:hypothetical protein
MLTAKQNFLETVKGKEGGGKPERFVKQYEPFYLINSPIYKHLNRPKPGEENKLSAWGVTYSWPLTQPGAYPVHYPEDLVVIKDFENWKDYVKAPNVVWPEAEWDACLAEADKVDRDEQYLCSFYAPGIFEQCHALGTMTETMMALYEYPDEVHDLIKYVTDWMLQAAEQICDHLHPDGIFQQDDWGSQISTFMSPDMFAEFLLEPYKELYGYYRSRGVELIIHHSDSYAETLVPYMIEMGIDVWQGVMVENDIVSLIEKYGDKITFMGGINSASVDYDGVTDDTLRAEIKRACDTYGPYHFIPGASQGKNVSSTPGVYERMDQLIDEYSKTYWAEHDL